MNETLKSLHDRFYTPLPLAEYEQEVETCHHQLIERLEKPERKLVLRIIDTQNHTPFSGRQTARASPTPPPTATAAGITNSTIRNI